MKIRMVNITVNIKSGKIDMTKRNSYAHIISILMLNICALIYFR